MIKRFVNKNIYEAEEQIIAQLVCCDWAINTNINSRMMDKFPEIKKEYEILLNSVDKAEQLLGYNQNIIIPKKKKIIINMYAIKNSSFIDAKSFEMCLISLSRRCKAPIAIEEKFGLDITQNYWDQVILLKIEKFLKNNEVSIYFS